MMKFTFARCVAALKRRPRRAWWVPARAARAAAPGPAGPKDLLQRLREAGL
ncbi:hypothetical protein [Eleftheria terrae]|uniref:hypothetical protein n=1 Tax=Eleftheria terrae TaxID=1597781 RepID=UPI00263AFF53|nr:hypothetical protein [Eleftheria terrae]WKB54984.1 hypothetical protein N7L95_11660 [Eleftheria terrae]